MLPPDGQLATKDKAALITELKRVDAAHDRLLLEHSDLKEKYAALEATLGTVVAELAALKARLAKDEKTKRGTFRSATPFSKQARKANPKAPGRKPGQGKFTNRGAPVEGPNDEIIHLDAPLASPNCPECDTQSERFVAKPKT